MNRLGAALLGEVSGPPIMSLYVFASNPAAIAPNAGLVAQGLMRDDLFTVVHELFLTDTADYADIVLPATSNLEQTDLHKAYGHTLLRYNHPAIPPLGESLSCLLYTSSVAGVVVGASVAVTSGGAAVVAVAAAVADGAAGGGAQATRASNSPIMAARRAAPAMLPLLGW